MSEIETRFLDLMKNLGVDKKTATPFLTDLIERYNEPQRFYHSLNHIKALLNHFDQIQSRLNDPLAAQLAIFYHNSVYDPTRSDNEVKSAELMKNHLQELIDNHLLQTAENLILMTQKHQLMDNLTQNNLSDAKYFLDMDLVILGSEPSIYQGYAKAIRQEYSHYSDNDYKKGRAIVLTNFLQRPRLFFSNHFFERLESQARQNLNQEIAQLSR